MTDLAVALTSGERSALAEFEATIERGLRTFVETGAALMAIRENRLYRESHQTFEVYCEERWGLSGRHAYRLIDGARVAELISRPVGQEINISERAARELAPLLDDPDELEAVWNEASQAGVVAPSAATIREVRAAREPQPEPKETRVAEPTAPTSKAATDDTHASVDASGQEPREASSAPTLAAAPSAVSGDSADGAVSPPTGPDPVTSVQRAIDQHAPDPQADHREWRRDFLKDVHTVHAVVRRGVDAVLEHADDECVREMYRCAERFADFAREIAAQIAKDQPNVIQLRRTS